ncbi:MAG TPA: ATP-binding cassette domain-containing protein [Casimicrobiaceae bacterium]
MGDADIVVGGLPIVASRVDVARGATLVLDAVDVTIEPRSRTFILGANGAGKSTLLRVLHGLIAPTRGRVTWGRSPARPRGHAMVFQRPVLLRRSAAGNIRHALALSGIRGREARRRIDDALASVGLDAIADRSARVLSGGEQQRLALARAWALAPEVLFLDEPTSSLDPPSARAVEAIVNDIHALGTTIVMTTHHLAQAKRLADSVVLLYGGRVAEHTDAKLFFREPRSAEGRTFLEGERL